MSNGNVKILMNWDIKPGLDQEYFEFVMREWVPNTTKLGLTPIEAWYSVYTASDIPKIMAGAIAEDADSMRRIITSSDWEDLQAEADGIRGKLQPKDRARHRGLSIVICPMRRVDRRPLTKLARPRRHKKRVRHKPHPFLLNCDFWINHPWRPRSVSQEGQLPFGRTMA